MPIQISITVGQIPNGNYNVTFTGMGQPANSTFYANGYTQYGLSASFTNNLTNR
jgi:hypothetical protein